MPTTSASIARLAAAGHAIWAVNLTNREEVPYIIQMLEGVGPRSPRKCRDASAGVPPFLMLYRRIWPPFQLSKSVC